MKYFPVEVPSSSYYNQLNGDGHCLVQVPQPAGEYLLGNISWAHSKTALPCMTWSYVALGMVNSRHECQDPAQLFSQIWS